MSSGAIPMGHGRILILLGLLKWFGITESAA